MQRCTNKRTAGKTKASYPDDQTRYSQYTKKKAHQRKNECYVTDILTYTYRSFNVKRTIHQEKCFVKDHFSCKVDTIHL